MTDTINGIRRPWKRVVYVYRDEAGAPLSRVIRLERGKGANREKRFHQERYENGHWIKGLAKIRRVPYQLEKVVGAKRVFIVEGEKDCQTLDRLGFVATTSPMGAGKWSAEYAPYFKGKRVVIIPDNDSPGRAHAAEEAASVLPVARSVQILELPDLPEKGDVTDWVRAGGTVEQLSELCSKAKPLDMTALATLQRRWGLVEDWPDALPLTDIQPEPLRRDLIPGPIGEFIQALAAWSETPVELPAVAVLGVLSCAVAGKLEVSPEAGYSEPCHLFLCAALESGNRKSSVLSAATSPLITVEKREREVLGPKIAHAVSVRKSRIALIDKARRLLKDFDADEVKRIADMEAALPKVPSPPEMFTGDTTSERLEMILAEQGGRAALISDEGGAFDVMAGRYSDKLNIDVFLKGHAGTPVRVHRVSRETVVVDSPALTILLSPQPGCLSELRNNAALRQRGLLARFLYVLPASPIGERALEPVPIPDATELAYTRIIEKLLDWKPTQRITLSLDSEAYSAWKAFQRSVETMMADGGKLSRLRDWGSKLPGAALRIAGILHAANPPRKTLLSVLSAELGHSEIQIAIRLCETLISHAIAVFGLISEDPETTNAKRLWRWLASQRKCEISKRDCFRAHQPHVFDRVELMDAPLSILERHHLVRVAERQTGGRPQEIIALNPALLEGK